MYLACVYVNNLLYQDAQLMQLFFYCLLPYTFAFPFSLTMSNLCDGLMINSKLPCFAIILSLSTFFLLEARHTDFSQKIFLLQKTNNTNKPENWDLRFLSFWDSAHLRYKIQQWFNQNLKKKKKQTIYWCGY